MIEIIPAIDIIDGHCVRLSQGDYDRKAEYCESPADMARRFADTGLQRIHVVDLDGAKASEPKNLRTLEKIAAVDGITVEWGGGLKSDIALRDVFNAGASWAIIGSIAASEPQMMTEWLTRYGNERIILGADARNGKIALRGWLEDSALTIDDLIGMFVPAGLSQAICTDISHDGMLDGPNFELYTGLQERWGMVTFTVSGGIGSMKDIEKLNELGLPRVIVGKAIYENHISLRDISNFLNL